MELAPEDDFQAWCTACEEVFEQENGWTDKAMNFAQVRIICENCYFEIKERQMR